jgi:hypothetical protein
MNGPALDHGTDQEDGIQTWGNSREGVVGLGRAKAGECAEGVSLNQREAQMPFAPNARSFVLRRLKTTVTMFLILSFRPTSMHLRLESELLPSARSAGSA